jgi:hypothetical protein
VSKSSVRKGSEMTGLCVKESPLGMCSGVYELVVPGPSESRSNSEITKKQRYERGEPRWGYARKTVGLIVKSIFLPF